jgi:MerR family transcriptional regulator, light-induced transcriptional regulator
VSAPESQARFQSSNLTAGSSPRSVRDEALRRTIEADLIPRLAITHRTGLFPPTVAAAAGRILDDDEVEEFVRVIRGLTEAGLDGYISGLLEDGAKPEAIYLDLMAPAARRLGELWEEDACSFMEVSLSLGRMQRVLRRLEGQFLSMAEEEGGDGRRILLTGLSGEQHTLGLILVAEFFIRDGWSVEVGTPFGSGDPVSRLAEEWYDVVGFSLACDDHLDRLTQDIRRARQVSRNRDLRVLVGGPPFVDAPDLALKVGADGSATDARMAPRVAGELCC